MRFDGLKRHPVTVVVFVCTLIVLLETMPWKGVASGAVDEGASSPLSISSINADNYPNVKVVATAPSLFSSQKISAANFRVIEGGESQAISATRLPSAELSVVLVIDTSKSMEGAALAAARLAAKAFVAVLPADVPVAIVGFGNTPTVASAFGTDRGITNAALAKLTARGNTTLYDAVIRAIGLLGERDSGAEYRKVVVLLTDGGDTRSVASLAEATSALRSSNVSLQAIALATRETDQAALASLASSANGTVVSATDPAALDGVFKGVADSVLNQYELSWVSLHGGPTSIEVELAVDQSVYQAKTLAAFPAKPSVAEPVGEKDTVVIAAPTPVDQPILAALPNDRWLWVVGVLTGFAALFFAWMALMWPRDARRRLAGEYSTIAVAMGEGVPTTGRFGILGRSVLFSRAVKAGNRTLRRRDPKRRLLGLLERAGSSVLPEEAAVVSGLVAVVSAAVIFFLAGPLAAVIGAIISVFGLIAWIRMRADKRSKLFTEQFESTLQIMSNSLKAGYGITQAIDTVAREAEAPTRDEFRRVVREAGLGMDQIVALEACAVRMKSQDLEWVTDAIAVNREVGGNLTELLAAVSETIRARHRLGRQVSALSAEGKISARILLSMPLLVFGWLFLTNRSYARELFSGPGPILLVAAGVSMTIGSLWLRRIIRVEY